VIAFKFTDAYAVLFFVGKRAQLRASEIAAFHLSVCRRAQKSGKIELILQRISSILPLQKF
jgi:hypothetical protein